MSKKEYFSLDKILSYDVQYFIFIERGKGREMKEESEDNK